MTTQLRTFDRQADWLLAETSAARNALRRAGVSPGLKHRVCELEQRAGQLAREHAAFQQREGISEEVAEELKRRETKL